MEIEHENRYGGDEGRILVYIYSMYFIDLSLT